MYRCRCHLTQVEKQKILQGSINRSVHPPDVCNKKNQAMAGGKMGRTPSRSDSATTSAGKMTNTKNPLIPQHYGLTTTSNPSTSDCNRTTTASVILKSSEKKKKRYTDSSSFFDRLWCMEIVNLVMTCEVEKQKILQGSINRSVHPPDVCNKKNQAMAGGKMGRTPSRSDSATTSAGKMTNTKNPLIPQHYGLTTTSNPSTSDCNRTTTASVILKSSEKKKKRYTDSSSFFDRLNIASTFSYCCIIICLLPFYNWELL
ncbi:unnamed protein product [Ilex paraguariensis]|uniref:Uncharacterized protein n=1 Tax=Ilex paraguariensis TaxID=185542 RepID=A0ABC8RB33_9AQUA